jgi:hypothetical protein
VVELPEREDFDVLDLDPVFVLLHLREHLLGLLELVAADVARGLLLLFVEGALELEQ